MNKFSTSQNEKNRAQAYFEELFSDMSKLPFSFKYGSQIYHGLDRDFSAVWENGSIIGRHRDGLEVRVEIKCNFEYAQFEWTVYFQNTSQQESETLSELLGADLKINKPHPELLYFIGDDAMDSYAYAPMRVPMRAGTFLEFQPVGGRPTSFMTPYYRFETQDEGMFLTVGWPGQWRARFDARKIDNYDYVNDYTVLFTADSQINGRLRPGEKIRTPLISVMLYDRQSDIRTVNLWRRWFMDCNMPRQNGELMQPGIFTSTSWLYNEMGQATDQNQIEAIKWYRDAGIKTDWHWMDAGWYFINGQTSISDWGWQTGCWEVDTKRFPSELRAVSDYAAQEGTRTLLWFEPERVQPDTFLWDTPWCLEIPSAGSKLADFGNPDFRKWLLERVISVLSRGGISLYRQDFNIDPLPFWKNQDAKEGRTGFAENRYVQGYLEYFDALLERVPGLIIDSCASGGRRNDLETMRRAVPLHKSDSPYSDHTKKQAMHHSLYQLFPYFTAMTAQRGDISHADQYAARSSFAPGLVMLYDVTSQDESFKAQIRRHCEQWRRISAFFDKEYIPLTAWSNNPEQWIAWQFMDVEKGEGLIQAYRREGCAQPSLSVRLYGIEPQSVYELDDFETKRRYLGSELEQYTIHLELRASAQIIIKKIQ
mgnify:FL=1|jgi:hypothetical protein